MRNKTNEYSLISGVSQLALSAQIQIQDTRYIYVSITHQRICVCIIWVSSTIATLSAICLLNADTTGGAGGGAAGGAEPEALAPFVHQL